MNQAFTEEMQAALLAEQKQLREELGRFATEKVNTKDDFRTRFPSYGSEQDDNAQEVTSYTDNLSLERDLETSLREVDAALVKIEKGTYGACERCGKEIGEERLRAMPAAALCADCAAKA